MPLWRQACRGTSPQLWSRKSAECAIRCISLQRYSTSSIQKDNVHIYISKSNDPYFNLSLEYCLFRKLPPGSKTLFLYKNRPCIVIGRNQNPWLEVNLPLLRPAHPRDVPSNLQHPGHAQKIDLIRRKSGGGTVFHDEGNMNWSIICDLTEFTRDKHAEMVVRALRALGTAHARVNKRHDIVLDQGSEKSPSDPADTHRTPWTSEGEGAQIPLKVSGSAYKMSGNRAMHHGTALLNSPNLGRISKFLRSPAKRYIKASGVDSVSSPVGNIGVDELDFMSAVQYQFGQEYGVSGIKAVSIQEGTFVVTGVDQATLNREYDELQTQEWTFLQTPKFTISTRPEELNLQNDSAPGFTMEVRQGVVRSCKYYGRDAESIGAGLESALLDKRVHDVQDWKSTLGATDPAIVDHHTERTEIRLSDFLGRTLAS